MANKTIEDKLLSDAKATTADIEGVKLATYGKAGLTPKG